MPQVPPSVVEVVRRTADRAAPLLLPVWFLVITANKVRIFAANGWLANDFHIYRNAAVSALSGQDAWASSVDGYRFAAPPPTLILYLPLAVLPERLALVVSMLVLVACTIFVLRRLALPWWWVLFPPLAESLIVLNPDVAVLALLLGGTASAAAAPMAKLYALIPMVLQARWRALVFAVPLLAVSLPLWPDYLRSFRELQPVLAEQASGGLSAWGTPLVVPVILALAVMGRTAASWLAVPTLWPATQLHYSCLALPAVAKRPVLAAAFSLAIPLLAPVAVVIVGVVEAVRRVRSAKSPPRDSSHAIGPAMGHDGRD